MLAWVLLGGLGVAAAGTSHAEALRACDRPLKLNADQHDKLLRFGGIIRDELERSGQRLALISRSGTDLSRFQMRYSHAGVTLLASENTPWSVRQLYYACDERKPRIFDQGIAGFVFGTEDAALGYVSVVLLPPAAAAALERSVLDKRLALRMLNPVYSANAYAFSALYQNCNQWVAEMLAAAWGQLSSDEADAADTQSDRGAGNPGPATDETLRSRAQAWLQASGYVPTVFDVGPALMLLGAFVPWVHDRDHPPADLERTRYRVSMPASIEAFVQAQMPGATRLEFCHTDRQVVIRRGWEALPEGCQPAAGDTVLALD